MPPSDRFDCVHGRQQPTDSCVLLAESIAFYSGEAREASMACRALALLVSTAQKRLAWALGLSLWANAYSYATILVPTLIMAPRFFAGEVEFGAISQVLCCPLPSAWWHYVVCGDKEGQACG